VSSRPLLFSREDVALPKILRHVWIVLFLMLPACGTSAPMQGPPTYSTIPGPAVATTTMPISLRQDVYHEVAPLESLWRISKIYDVDQEDIIDANRIQNPAQIEVGQVLLVPDAARQRPVIPLYNERRWSYIVIHHTATETGNAKLIHDSHHKRGFVRGADQPNVRGRHTLSLEEIRAMGYLATGEHEATKKKRKRHASPMKVTRKTPPAGFGSESEDASVQKIEKQIPRLFSRNRVVQDDAFAAIEALRQDAEGPVLTGEHFTQFAQLFNNTRQDRIHYDYVIQMLEWFGQDHVNYLASSDGFALLNAVLIGSSNTLNVERTDGLFEILHAVGTTLPPSYYSDRLLANILSLLSSRGRMVRHTALRMLRIYQEHNPHAFTESNLRTVLVKGLHNQDDDIRADALKVIAIFEEVAKGPTAANPFSETLFDIVIKKY